MEAEQTKKKVFTKKRLIIIAVVIVVFISAIGIAGFLLMRNKQDKAGMPSQAQMADMGEGVITATGLTSAGMLEETWELDFLETSLYVEESYLSAGDSVESGTAVFKVSEESLEEARKELEDKLTEANLAYRQGVIDYETDSIDARVTGDVASVNQKYAQAEYDSSVSKAAKTVENLEKQVEEASELAEEYTKSVTEDYYRTYYKVDELYQTYYEHFTLLMAYYENWNIEELEDLYGNVSAVTIGSSQSSAGQGGTSSGQGSSSSNSSASVTDIPTMERSTAIIGADTIVGADMAVSADKDEGDDEDAEDEDDSKDDEDGDDEDDDDTDDEDEKKDSPMPGQGGEFAGQSGMEGMGGGLSSEGSSGMTSRYSENETKLAVYNAFDEMVKEEADAYTTALENYESAKKKAVAGLDQAVSDLATLEAELVQAQADYQNSLIMCQADYQTTLAESDNAQSVYETTMQSLEETLASLTDDKEEAEENLALFEEVIGDGYFYTQNAGTIVMNGVRRESYLSGEAMIIAYSNPEKVTISASVSQSDIAQISVGDGVYVVVSEYGNYAGKVTEINPVTQAQSRSSVTYQVQVVLEGDVSTLESNLTAYLYFGVSDEMMKQIQGGSSEKERPGRMNSEDMPEGTDREGMPEGMDMENMPEGMDRESMPEGMDMENMPEGMDREGMPEGMDRESMPEGMDREGMPEGMDREGMPGGRGGNADENRQGGESE